MKRILLLSAFFITFCSLTYAQNYKIIDRSANKVPQWIYTEPEDCIVVETEAPNLSEAKDRAIEELIRRVITSVALNVEHTSVSKSSFENNNGNVNESESSLFNTQTAAARIPYIKGISLTEARDTYWEKCREKKTNRIFFRYCLLYPLSKNELRKMRDEFHAEDTKKDNQLKELKKNLNNVSSASDIENAVSELEVLKGYFIDNSRRSEAEGLQKNYKQLYKGLTLEVKNKTSNSFDIIVLLDGKPFKVSGIPVLKANCASRLEASPLPDTTGFKITFDNIDCLEEEDNWIDVNLKMRETRLSKKIFI